MEYVSGEYFNISLLDGRVPSRCEVANRQASGEAGRQAVDRQTGMSEAFKGLNAENKGLHGSLAQLKLVL